MYNEIEGNYDDVAISTFKRGLPTEHGLRKSLTGKPVTSVRNSWIELTNIKGSRKTSRRGRAKRRLSLKRGGISGRTALTTVTGRKETTRNSLDPLGHRQSMLCFENHYTRS